MKYVAQSVEILNSFLNEEISKDDLETLYTDGYVDKVVMEGFAMVAQDVENGEISIVSQGLLTEAAESGLFDGISIDSLVESGLVDLESVSMLSEDEVAYLSEGKLKKAIGAGLVGAALLGSGAANVYQYKQNQGLQKQNAQHVQQIKKQGETIQGQHTKIDGLKVQLQQAKDDHVKLSAQNEANKKAAAEGSGIFGKKTHDVVNQGVDGAKKAGNYVGNKVQSGWNWVKKTTGLDK